MVASAPTAQAQSPSRTRLIAQLVFVAGLLANLVTLLVGLGTDARSATFQASQAGDLAGFVLPICLLATGLLLRTRRPDNAIGWLFLAFGVAATAATGFWVVMLVNHLPGGNRDVGALAAWLGSVVSISTFAYLIIALIIRFPTGMPATAADGRLLRWLPVFCAALGLATAVRPGPMLIYSAFDNPIATPPGPAAALTLISDLVAAGLLVPLLVAGSSMARRYRESSDIERLQLRWFAFGTGFALVTTALYVLVTALLDIGPNGREVAYVLFAVSLTSLPVAVFEAIATHRLYDIDRIIGRTFAYGALTAILAGLYAASIRLFNWLFVDLTGQDSELSLVLTTLVLTTSFTPIKGRLEKQAARRFRFELVAANEEHAAAAAALDAADLAALEARLERRVDAAVRRAVDDVERRSSPASNR
ncbi:MAG TPA: hypothetical protein VE011_06720 [Candidatus Dormibacteraeota bacterium]|nr:hypothetical protein [Candidatus Dormibacteraeota bacterium]